MSSENSSITNNDFEASAPNTFRQLWNDEDFTDVTLATVDNQQINAHKVILSSCSPVFRNILLKNRHQNPLIYLKDVQYYDLNLLLEYIYLGECQVANEDLVNFIKIGEELKINGLVEQPKKQNPPPSEQTGSPGHEESPEDELSEAEVEAEDLGNVTEERVVVHGKHTQAMDIPLT